MADGISLLPWQGWALLGLGGVTVVYVAYFQIWLTFAFASDLLFAFALALGVISIATPTPFERAAEALIRRSPLPTALAAADSKLEALTSFPQRVIDDPLQQLGLVEAFEDLLRRLGLAHDPEASDSVTPAASQTTSGAQRDAQPVDERAETFATKTLEPEAGEGPVTRWIQPSVEALMTLVLRVSGFILSGLLLFIALAGRASATTARRLRHLAARVDALESPNASLEDGIERRAP
jgi:hypothetical protein